MVQVLPRTPHPARAAAGWLVPSARVLAIGSLLVAAACGVGPQTPAAAPASRSASSVPSSPSSTDRPTLPAGAVVETERGAPIGVADIDGSAWFALDGSGEVRTGDGGTVAVGSHPLRLASAPGGGAWVSLFGGSEMVRVGADGTVRARTSFRGKPEGIAANGGQLWVVDAAGDAAVLLDAATGKERDRVPVPAGPRLLSLVGSTVWVSSFATGAVTGIRRDGLRVAVQRDGVCRGPHGVLESGSTVWVACTAENVVLGLDPADLSEVARIDLDSADALASAGEFVYAVGQRGPTVVTIDPHARTEVARVPLGAHARVADGNVGAVVVGGHLVLTHPEAEKIWRVVLGALR